MLLSRLLNSAFTRRVDGEDPRPGAKGYLDGIEPFFHPRHNKRIFLVENRRKSMARRLSDADIEYIKQAKAHNMPNAQIAKNLDCTIRSVQKYAKQLSADTLELVKDPAAQQLEDADAQDTLTRLKEARDILRMQMLVADARNVAGIVKEYRAACEDVERLEGEESERIRENQADSNDPVAQALAAFKA